MSQNSVSLVRVFCFQDGYDLGNNPIQSSPGVWDEEGLQRIDLILAQAAQYGIYVIILPTNFEPVGGGIQWYVDEVNRSVHIHPHIDNACKHLWRIGLRVALWLHQALLTHATLCRLHKGL